VHTQRGYGRRCEGLLPYRAGLSGKISHGAIEFVADGAENLDLGILEELR
jgi:hypothetical protein